MKEKKMQFYKTIPIPHLKFTLYIQDMSKLKGIEIKDGGYTTRIDGEEYHCKACIFFPNVKEMVKISANLPIIAHEVMHVIQILCEDYSMSIEEEKEHTAYLMTYLLEEIVK